MYTVASSESKLTLNISKIDFEHYLSMLNGIAIVSYAGIIINRITQLPEFIFDFHICNGVI